MPIAGGCGSGRDGVASNRSSALMGLFPGLINKNVADVFIARPVRKLRAGFGFQVGDVAGAVSNPCVEFVVTRDGVLGLCILY